MSAVEFVTRAIEFLRSLSVFKFYKSYTKTYFLFVAMFAIVGYAYLLLFPCGAIYASIQLYDTFLLPFDDHMLVTALGWVSIMLFCIGITLSIAMLKFKTPEGITLSPKNAQSLFDKIEEIEKDIMWPKIHNVVLSQRFELDIVKTPLCYMPFWSTNTLVIGYPFMQTLPPEYFDCALTRKLIQYSKRSNSFSNWLSYLRSTWSHYPVALKQRNFVGDQLAYWFFRVYNWSYNRLALYITQVDELAADTLALRKLNDRDMFKTAESEHLIKTFLNEYYWPKLSKALTQNTMSPEQLKPYEHLPKASSQMLSSNMASHWLNSLILEIETEGSHTPPFSKRMHTMGYAKIYPLKPFKKNAADHYFGPANHRLVKHMNKLWAIHVKKALENQDNSCQCNPLILSSA